MLTGRAGAHQRGRGRLSVVCGSGLFGGSSWLVARPLRRSEAGPAVNHDRHLAPLPALPPLSASYDPYSSYLCEATTASGARRGQRCARKARVGLEWPEGHHYLCAAHALKLYPNAIS